MIASTAAAGLNALRTGTFRASNINNVESYNVNSYSFGVGTGSVFLNGTGGVNNTGGSLLPSFLGLSFTLPTFLTAYGDQSSLTFSALSQADTVITSGEAQSLAALGSLSRDTTITNSALTRQFTEARRADIADDFAAARQLVTEVTVFFANRAAEQAALERRSMDAALTQAQRDTARDEAAAIGTRYGSGSDLRLIATAISGAAGGNVTGSLGSFVQAAAVNAVQAFATQRAAEIADAFTRQDPTRPNDPTARIPTVGSEVLRTALQGLVGCAGGATSGNCGSGALGAGSSAALNSLITALLQPEPRDPVTGNIVPRSLADQQTRTALIATLTGAIAGAVGANAGVASNAGVIETENNALSVNGTTARFAGCYVGSRVCTTAEARAKTDAFFTSDPEGRLFLQASNGNQALAESCIRNDSTPACRAVQTRLNELTTARDSIVVRVDLYDLVRNGGALLNSAGQAIGYVDANYGQIVTRTLGVAQGAAGVFDVVAGAGTVAVGAGSCLPTIGAGCAAALGGVVIIGAGLDNIYAGGATAIGGRYVSTIGARGLSSLTGLSIQTTELLYGFSTFGVSAAQGGLQRLVRNSAARAQTRIAGEAVERLALTTPQDLVPLATQTLGQWGESRLANFLGGQGIKPVSSFSTPLGPRFADRVLDGVAYESKAGRNVKLTSAITKQIAKDQYLISIGRVRAVEWHFWRGAQPEVLQALTNAGIRSVVH